MLGLSPRHTRRLGGKHVEQKPGRHCGRLGWVDGGGPGNQAE